MCYHPIRIYNSTSKRDFGIVFKEEYRLSSAIPSSLKNRVYIPRSGVVMDAPCGKCVDCLRRRQNDIAARAYREASKCGNMWSLTFTYSEDDVPLLATPFVLNDETGEVVELGEVGHILTRFPQGNNPYPGLDVDGIRNDLIRPLLRSRKPRVAFVFAGDYGLQDLAPAGWTFGLRISPSLFRRDIRLWLKKSRVRYERDRGEKLPDFKYVFAGEYGPKTCRPHYHMLVFGLDWYQVHFLLSQWTYGFYFCRKVKAYNNDGSSGFAIAARYVSKYLVKGKFNPDEVDSGYVEKPRVCLSRYVGNWIDDSMISYYLCYDLFGRYDKDTLLKSDGKKLTESELCQIFDEYQRRNKVVVNDKYYFRLPKSCVDKLFNVYDKAFSYKFHQTVEIFRASSLRRVFQYFVESGISAADQQISDAYNSDLPISSFEDFYSMFTFSSEVRRFTDEVADETSLYKFYNSSKLSY